MPFHDLTDQYIGSTFQQLLHVPGGVTSNVKAVYDGDGTLCPLYLGTESVSIFGLLTVGSDGLGSDVRFYGGTSGKYMLWDKSENELLIEGNLRVEGDSTFSGSSVYLKDAAYNSGTPVKALSLNTSDGAIKIAGVEMKANGAMKLKKLASNSTVFASGELGDMVMRTDGITVKTEPYVYMD